MNICIIPARGGSKRIPRKNIKDFCGKPIIAWSIEAAIQSGCFDEVIVSTDDIEIANISNQYGAATPFFRPPELSNDYIGTIPVVAHATKWLENNGITPKYVCCIYATAPLISQIDIRVGLNQLLDQDCAYTLSVTSYAFPIQRAIRLTSDNRIAMFSPENFNTRSQDLEEAYHDAGQFYWGKAESWLAGRPVLDTDSIPIVLPRWRVQDIDTLEDWDYAELLFRTLQASDRI